MQPRVQPHHVDGSRFKVIERPHKLVHYIVRTLDYRAIVFQKKHEISGKLRGRVAHAVSDTAFWPAAAGKIELGGDLSVALTDILKIDERSVKMRKKAKVAVRLQGGDESIPGAPADDGKSTGFFVAGEHAEKAEKLLRIGVLMTI